MVVEVADAVATKANSKITPNRILITLIVFSWLVTSIAAYVPRASEII